MKKDEVRNICIKYNSIKYKLCDFERAIPCFSTKTILIGKSTMPMKNGISKMNEYIRRYDDLS